MWNEKTLSCHRSIRSGCTRRFLPWPGFGSPGALEADARGAAARHPQPVEQPALVGLGVGDDRVGLRVDQLGDVVVVVLRPRVLDPLALLRVEVAVVAGAGAARGERRALEDARAVRRDAEDARAAVGLVRLTPAVHRVGTRLPRRDRARIRDRRAGARQVDRPARVAAAGAELVAAPRVHLRDRAAEVRRAGRRRARRACRRGGSRTSSRSSRTRPSPPRRGVAGDAGPSVG